MEQAYKLKYMALKGVKQSPEHIKKLADARRGHHWKKTPKQIREMKIYLKGHKKPPRSEEHRKKLSEWAIKNKHTPPHPSGKDHPCWTGDDCSWSAVHDWIRKQKGKANEYLCKCGKQAREWSNKDHRYKRKLSDYTARCKPCHYKYDLKYNKNRHKPK